MFRTIKGRLNTENLFQTAFLQPALLGLISGAVTGVFFRAQLVGELAVCGDVHSGLLNQLIHFIGIFHITQRVSATEADCTPFEHGFHRAHIHPQVMHIRQFDAGNIQPDQSGGAIQAPVGERLIDAVPIEKTVNRRKDGIPHRHHMKQHEEIHVREKSMRCGIKSAHKKQVKQAPAQGERINQRIAQYV